MKRILCRENIMADFDMQRLIEEFGIPSKGLPGYERWSYDVIEVPIF